jgi:hypothetical protein
MRYVQKKASLVIAGAVVAIGAGLGVAAPANAAEPAVPSYYPDQQSCLDAKAQTGKTDLVCNQTIGKPKSEAWVLTVIGG